MCTRQIMLDIAREALLHRAVRDGYRPGEYNPEDDDEGYVISLLVALRHWCREHRLDWPAELERAHELYLEDLAEAGLEP